MNEQQEGPKIREVHSLSYMYRVCGDCKYHVRQAWLRGQRHSTDNYSCKHPDFNDALHIGLMGEGRTIAFNSEETPQTPSWCPFLKQL